MRNSNVRIYMSNERSESFSIGYDCLKSGRLPDVNELAFFTSGCFRRSKQMLKDRFHSICFCEPVLPDDLIVQFLMVTVGRGKAVLDLLFVAIPKLRWDSDTRIEKVALFSSQSLRITNRYLESR